MPYIQVRSNKKIEKEQEVHIKTKIGEAVTIIGKSESWLMLEIVDQCRLYFKGDNNKNIAYVDVKMYGSSSSECYNEMTKTICTILNDELEISPDNVYVSYGEYSNWGWNGNNF